MKIRFVISTTMFLLTDDLWFPDPTQADEEGLVAVGGDLTAERLLLAYRSGIFPWFSMNGLIHWFCPPQRMVLYPNEIRVSHSMKQILGQGKFHITENKAFSQVISHCSKVHRETKGVTWIDEDFIEAYNKLHRLGFAHSIEVWNKEKLAGGLYGIVIGNLFCGESMFSIENNASKAALIYLCQNKNYSLIDCQVPTPHLQTMGARVLEREEFLKEVKRLSVAQY